MKRGVWCTQNHRFHLSSFAAKCLEKCVQGALIWDTLATNIGKRPSKETSKMIEKSTPKKHRILVNVEYFFLVLGPPFFNFFGPGTHLTTKAPTSKKKVTGMTANLLKMIPEI